MNTVIIEDLPRNEALERDAMQKLRGGIGRTPQQIGAWELSGRPATWQGLVLNDDGTLGLPSPR